MTELNKMVTSNRRLLLTSMLRWVYVQSSEEKDVAACCLLLQCEFIKSSESAVSSELAIIKRIKIPETNEAKEKWKMDSALKR